MGNRMKTKSFKNQEVDLKNVSFISKLANILNLEPAWGSARCVEGHAIRRKVLSKLWFEEGRGCRALAPYMFKYTES